MKERKWFRFSDRDPGALRSRLRDVNELAQFIIDYPNHGKWDELFDKAREIERLSRVDT